jgi:hypothetical protein
MDGITVSAQGSNPMRWNCSENGCFNKKCRPKIEQFAECFPGRINFGDVDGLVEIGGRFLMLEWKSYEGDIPTGQRISFEHLVATGRFTILIVAGDAETMEVKAMALLQRNSPKVRWKPATLEDVQDVLRAWASIASVTKKKRAIA